MILMLLPMVLWGQNWKYDFGTGTGTFNTASTISTTFLPAPPSGGGNDAVRIGSGGGSANLDNSGLTGLGTSTELRIVAPTGASINKFMMNDYTAAKTFTTKFTILLGNSSGGSTANSGTFYFFQGDGSTYADGNAFSGTQVFTGLRFAFGSSGAITLNNRAGGSWNTTGISGTPFAQGNVYQVEIIGNNTTATITYSRGSVAANTFDLYVNGTLVGNDLAKAQLGNDVNIDSWMFYGESSTGNVANIFLDDIEYANYICGNITTNASTESSMSAQCTDGDWTVYGTTTNRHFAIDKTGTSGLTGETVTISVDATAFSNNSSNGANQEHASFFMKRGWDVTAPAFTGAAKVRFYYESTDSADAVAARNTDSIAKKTANPSSHLRNTPFTWFKSKNAAYTTWRSANVRGNHFTAGTYDILTPTYGSQNGVRYVEFSGITSFSGGSGGVGFGPGAGGGSSGVGLPVTWAGFDVVTTEAGNELIWKTASEQSTDYFEVQYSYDALQWSVVNDQIAAAGNSADLRTYTFTHSDFAPYIYYRIKQVDLDDKFEYSAMKLAKRSAGPSFVVSVYPIPMENNDNLNVSVKGIDKSPMNISMKDMTGKVIRNINFIPSSEIVGESFDMSPLAPGIYFIEVQNGQGREVFKVSR